LFSGDAILAYLNTFGAQAQFADHLCFLSEAGAIGLSYFWVPVVVEVPVVDGDTEDRRLGVAVDCSALASLLCVGPTRKTHGSRPTQKNRAACQRNFDGSNLRLRARVQDDYQVCPDGQ